MRLAIAPIIVILMALTPLAAQPPAAAQSTGQDGQLLPGPFRVYAVNGSRAKHFHCFFCENDLNPTVAVIALAPPADAQDPLAVLMQKLDAFAAANKPAKVGVFAIFVTHEKEYLDELGRDAKVGAIEGLITNLKLQGPILLGLTLPDAQPVKQFGIVTKDDQINNIKKHQTTVLVYNKHKVEKRFTFTDDKKLDEAGIKEIFAAAEKMLPAAKK